MRGAGRKLLPGNQSTGDQSVTIKKVKTFYCPAEITLRVIGGKWKPIIMWTLRHGSQRFSDIKNELPVLAHKVLSQQLKQLEADGLIERKFDESSTSRARYELTDKGRSIYPTLIYLARWGLAHHEHLSVEYRPSEQITPRVLKTLAGVGDTQPSGT